MNRRPTDSRQTDKYHRAWKYQHLYGTPAYVNMTEMARKKVETMKGMIMDRLPTTYHRLEREFKTIHPDLIAEALVELENEKTISFSDKAKEWELA